MSENRNLLIDTAEALFAEHANSDFETGYEALAEAGFPHLLVSPERGGFGGDWGDLAAILRIAGAKALALPLAETIIAHHLLDAAGLDAPEGFVALAAYDYEGRAVAGAFYGRVSAVPWGRYARHVLATNGVETVLIDCDGASCSEGSNPAGEPRDALTFDRETCRVVGTGVDILPLLAFARVGQSAGALDTALAMSIEHSNQRQQFGRPLAKFQAVQQSLAVFAVECAAVACAAQGAADALDRFGADGAALFEIAAAKLRTNEALATGSALAHQAHGAIGFTAEYPLHGLTKRMMGWRSEAGNDAYWAERLGGQAIALGGTGLWRDITRRTDAA